MKGRAASTIAIATACVLALLGSGCALAGSAELVVSPQVASVSPIPTNVGSYEPGELIVGLADETAGDASDEFARHAIEAAGAKAIETLAHATEGRGATLLVHTDADHRTGDDLAAAAQSIANVRGVSYVQPNYHYSTATNANKVATDSDVSKQYYLNDWESSHGANVAAAWGAVGTSDKVDVAVLDTGVYVMQEYDSNGNLRTASGDGFDISENFHQEFDGSNLDLADGRDFVHSESGSELPLVNEENPFGDDNGHGTHIAGIIAAHARTAQTPDAMPVGMAGVSQNARVIPVKVLDSAGEGTTDDFIRAYDYLIQKKQSGELANLHVINMSLALTLSDGESDGEDDGDDSEIADEEGDDRDPDADDWEDETGLSDDDASADDSVEPGPAFQQQIQAAERLGIATVCAIGNKAADDTAEYQSYPSAYEECISVAALAEDGTVADYSIVNGDVDVCAPGSGIYSSWGSQADAYAKLDGTSQATAIVSGVLSMMWAKNPSMSVADAKAALAKTGHDVSVTRTTTSKGAATASSSYQAAANSALSAGAISTQGGGETTATRTYKLKAVDAAGILGYSPKTPLAAKNVTLGYTSKAYTGAALKPSVTVKVGGATLKSGTDYSVSYSKNTNVGTATVTVTGEGAYKGTVTKTFEVTARKLVASMVVPPKAAYAYTGKAIKPVPVVKIGTTKVVATNYTVTGYKNNKAIGTATITVKGKKNLGAQTVKTTFKIVPKATAISKLAAGGKCFTAQWKKQPTQTTGYQLRYSLKKNMASAKMLTVTRSATTKLKVSKLAKGKTYYVQVRTYKQVGKTKYCSPWSAAKSVKAK